MMKKQNNHPDGRYSDLRHKTIFDFCKDARMIYNIIIISKDTYLNELKSYPSLIEYAEKTNNKDLLDAVTQQYKKELEEENNE